MYCHDGNVQGAVFLEPYPTRCANPSRCNIPNSVIPFSYVRCGNQLLPPATATAVFFSSNSSRPLITFLLLALAHAPPSPPLPYPLHREQSDKPSTRILAMDRVAAASGGGGGRAGRGGDHNRSSFDEGYAAHAASPSGHKRGRERSIDSGGGGSGRDRNSSATRDEFKEYALALRKRDRRGRVDEPVERERERAGGRFRRDKDYSHVRFLLSDVCVCVSFLMPDVCVFCVCCVRVRVRVRSRFVVLCRGWRLLSRHVSRSTLAWSGRRCRGSVTICYCRYTYCCTI